MYCVFEGFNSFYFLLHEVYLFRFSFLYLFNKLDNPMLNILRCGPRYNEQ